MIPWMIIAILVLLVLFGVIAVIMAYKNKGKKKEPDYYTFFVLGLVWLPFGIFELIRNDMPTFFILGLTFFAIGITHKDKWKKNHVSFKKYPKYKKILTIGTIILGALVFLALIVLYLLKR